VWGYQDANNYYLARLNPLEDNYRVYKVVAGQRIQLETREQLRGFSPRPMVGCSLPAPALDRGPQYPGEVANSPF
jgi:hypothetical protein